MAEVNLFDFTKCVLMDEDWMFQEAETLLSEHSQSHLASVLKQPPDYTNLCHFMRLLDVILTQNAL